MWIKLIVCVNKVVDKLGQVVKKTFSDFGDKLWISRGKIGDSLGISWVVKDNHSGDVRGELLIKLWANCEYVDKVVDKYVNNEIENVFKIL